MERNPKTDNMTTTNQTVDSNMKFINFTLNWEIGRSEFEKICSQPKETRKYFITAYKNIVYRWSATLKKQKVEAEKSSMFKFGINFADGPREKIETVGLEIVIIGDAQSTKSKNVFHGVVRHRHLGQGVDLKLRPKSLSATLQFTIQIPTEAFLYDVPKPIYESASSKQIAKFNSIEDSEKSKFWDARLVSREGDEFYCHKVFVGESEPLEIMLNNPLQQLGGGGNNDDAFSEPPANKKPKIDDEESTSENLSTNNNNNVKKGYDFDMAKTSLKAMLQYLYTGNLTLSNLSVSEVIEVGDAGELYDLKPLKVSCAAELWKRAADDPRAAFEIVVFAHVHEEIYLKDRAMDVVAENYENMNIEPQDLPEAFAMYGKELRDELISYTTRRLRPTITA